MDRIKIEAGSIQETLMMPLYGRVYCSQHYPGLFPDKAAEQIVERIDYDFSVLVYRAPVMVTWALRAKMMSRRVKSYLATHPRATIVNLGCGLDMTFEKVDNGKCRFVNLDLPDVIAAREQVAFLQEREMNMAADIFDPEWMDRLQKPPYSVNVDEGVYFLCAGVLMYFGEDQLRTLFTTLAEHFPGGGIVFDVMNELGRKRSNRIVQKTGNGSEVRFAADAPRETFRKWSRLFSGIKELSRLPKYVEESREIDKGTKAMLKLALKMGMMKIVEIGFEDKDRQVKIKQEAARSKIHIEKNSVQETLIIPLFGRKMCTEQFPRLFSDPRAVELIDRLDYDFTPLEKKAKSLAYRFGALEVAMRENDLMYEVKEYLKDHPGAAVVNLGCGLDQTAENVDNGKCTIYNIDKPDVIAIREELIDKADRVVNIPADLNDLSWFDQIDDREGVVFMAAGVFYYFLKDQIRTLFTAMAKRFPGGKLVFDAAGERAVKMMVKTWIKEVGITSISDCFAVEDIDRDIRPWLQGAEVSAKGYMLGYNDLSDPSLPGVFRTMARLGDGAMKMKIVRIDFTGEK